jgi:endonuclease/exonuclease/phosphatase family metal-dependent hydrolase
MRKETTDNERQMLSDGQPTRATVARLSRRAGKCAPVYVSTFLALACGSLLAAYGLLSPSSHAVGAQAADDTAGNLFETGSPAKPAPVPARAPTEIKIVSYNIRWRGGDDLLKLIEHLRNDAEIGGAQIIGLQEVDRRRKRTGNVNTARQMADALGMHYAWAAPPFEKGDEEEPTGVAILSPYPLTDVERFVLPNEGPNERRRAGVGATVRLGERDVRVYSIHAETRIKMERKMEQLKIALDDMLCHPEIRHAVVLGDFNTIKDKDIRGARKLFSEAGFHTPFSDDADTFKTFIIKLKLDWIWLRGINANAHGITRRIGLSDHWPLWVTARLDPPPDVKTDVKTDIAKKEQRNHTPATHAPLGQCTDTQR